MIDDLCFQIGSLTFGAMCIRRLRFRCGELIIDLVVIIEFAISLSSTLGILFAYAICSFLTKTFLSIAPLTAFSCSSSVFSIRELGLFASCVLL